MNRKVLCLAALAFASVSLHAAVLQLSLTPEIALEPSTERVTGLLLNLKGENPQAGLALGIINGSTGESGGISLGVLCSYADDYSGAQLGLLNSASDFSGLQVAAINLNLSGGGDNWVPRGGETTGLQIGIWNVGGKTRGIQIGGINAARDLKGIQLGAINLLGNTSNGVQVGAFNYAENLSGLQIGIYNRANNLYGVQLGLLNWVDASPWFSETPNKLATIFPLINWSF